MTRLSSTACFALCLLLSACSRTPSPAEPAKPTAQGDVVFTDAAFVIRANALQTSTLNEAVAKNYGIARDDKTVLLLVGVRAGDKGDERSLPARISVTVSGLTGDKREMEMRELRTGDLVDYVGSI